jgi:hypothetical protein
MSIEGMQWCESAASVICERRERQERSEARCPPNELLEWKTTALRGSLRKQDVTPSLLDKLGACCLRIVVLRSFGRLDRHDMLGQHVTDQQAQVSKRVDTSRSVFSRALRTLMLLPGKRGGEVVCTSMRKGFACTPRMLPSTVWNTCELAAGISQPEALVSRPDALRIRLHGIGLHVSPAKLSYIVFRDRLAFCEVNLV